MAVPQLRVQPLTGLTDKTEQRMPGDLARVHAPRPLPGADRTMMLDIARVQVERHRLTLDQLTHAKPPGQLAHEHKPRVRRDLLTRGGHLDQRRPLCYLHPQECPPSASLDVFSTPIVSGREDVPFSATPPLSQDPGNYATASTPLRGCVARKRSISAMTLSASSNHELCPAPAIRTSRSFGFFATRA